MSSYILILNGNEVFYQKWMAHINTGHRSRPSYLICHNFLSKVIIWWLLYLFNKIKSHQCHWLNIQCKSELDTRVAQLGVGLVFICTLHFLCVRCCIIYLDIIYLYNLCDCKLYFYLYTENKLMAILTRVQGSKYNLLGSMFMEFSEGLPST